MDHTSCDVRVTMKDIGEMSFENRKDGKPLSGIGEFRERDAELLPLPKSLLSPDGTDHIMVSIGKSNLFSAFL